MKLFCNSTWLLFLIQVDFEVAGAEVDVVEDLEVVDVVEEDSEEEEGVVADVDSEVSPFSILKFLVSPFYSENHPVLATR